MSLAVSTEAATDRGPILAGLGHTASWRDTVDLLSPTCYYLFLELSQELSPSSSPTFPDFLHPPYFF